MSLCAGALPLPPPTTTHTLMTQPFFSAWTAPAMHLRSPLCFCFPSVSADSEWAMWLLCLSSQPHISVPALPGLCVFHSQIFIKNPNGPFFQIGASKRRPLGCLLLSEGDLLFPPPMNPTSQPLGKARPAPPRAPPRSRGPL